MLQGYNQIRLSVVELARVFEVESGLLDRILVRGDEIPQGGEGRIVTRSQRKKGHLSHAYYCSSIPRLTLYPMSLFCFHSVFLTASFLLSSYSILFFSFP